MQENEHDRLHAAISAKLAQVAAASSTTPLWHAGWTRLGPESSEEERLTVYQTVRHAGSVPEDAGFYLIAWQIDAITLRESEEKLQYHETRLDALRRKGGLAEHDVLSPGCDPFEYDDVEQQLHDAWDSLYAAILDEFGEHDMARLFRSDREQFEGRSEAGRRFFYGPRSEVDNEPSGWLDDLLEAVTACVEAESLMGPLGLRYREEEDFWEVWIYPTPVELIGGAQDGAVVQPGFSLDLERLRSEFDSVVAFTWNVLGLNFSEGPHVSIEGAFRGHDVFVQVLAQAPEDEQPGLKLDAMRKPRGP